MTCLHLDVALEGEKRPLKLVSFQFKVPSQLSGSTKEELLHKAEISTVLTKISGSDNEMCSKQGFRSA